MKRRITSLLLALCLVLSLAANVFAYPDIYNGIEEEDCNDTLWDAQSIKLGKTYEGQAIAYCGDSDLYTFTLEEATEIRISMAAGDIAMDLALFDSKGKLLANGEHLGFWGEDPDGRQLFNIFPMELDAGTYYVGVWTTDGTNNSYWFSVKEGVFPCGGYHRAFVHEFITPATCQSEGEWTCICLCGDVTTETVPVNPDVHTFETEIVTPSTCTERGLAVHTCTGCGYVEEEILWAEHTAPGKLIIQEPTADEYGFYYLTCADCGYVDYEEERALYPLDHTFIDVEPGAYYELPVCWAVYKEITTGSDAYHFNPTGECMRAQIVTFLWRAAGCPVVEAENPFTDVKEKDFYYNAVLWAVDQGITTGTSATTFSPFKTCSRAEVVTFLWRAHGKPGSNAENPFVDVKDTDFFHTAVLWAVENGITNGMDATHFGSLTVCNRAQVVTFLYRAKDVPHAAPDGKYTFELKTNDPTEEIGWAYCEGTEFAAGESVVFYAEPWFGYLVEFEAEDELELYYLGACTYELIMPDHDVTLTVNFVPAQGDAHYIRTTCENAEFYALCDVDEDFNDIAKPGEFVQFYVMANEGYTLTPENITLTAGGESWNEWWFLGQVSEPDPELELGSIFVFEAVMPDADLDVSITCTAEADAQADAVRVPVSVK